MRRNRCIVAARLVAKRNALHNPHDQRMRPVLLLLHLLDNLIDRTRIFVRQRASERVSEHFGGQMAHEVILAGQRHLFQFCGPRESRTVGQLTTAVNRLSRILRSPPSQYVIVLKAETERVDAVVATGTLGILPVLF